MPKILVADDSATIRGVAESLLRQNGFEVISSSDGSKALAMVKSQKPDLIFLDHYMPGKNGLSICQELKSDPLLKKIPVVMLLGASEMKESNKFLSAGASDCLFKPFVPKDFIEKARKYATPPAPKTQRSLLEEDTDKLASKAVSEEVFTSAAENEDLGLDELLGEALLSESEESTGPVPIRPQEKSPSKMGLGSRKSGEFEDMTIKLYNRPSKSQAPPAQKSKEKPVFGPAKPDADKLKVETDKDSLILASDPFGLSEKDLGFISPPPKEGPHDYEWFLKEMQKETTAPSPSSQPLSPTPAPATPKKRGEVSEDLKLKVEELGTSRLGYERFINEFKKEMMKLETEEKPVYGETRIEPQAVVEAQKKVSTDKVKTVPPTAPTEITAPVALPVTAPAVAINTEELVTRLISEVAKEIALRVSAQLNQEEIVRILEEKLVQLKN